MSDYVPKCLDSWCTNLASTKRVEGYEGRRQFVYHAIAQNAGPNWIKKNAQSLTGRNPSLNPPPPVIIYPNVSATQRWGLRIYLVLLSLAVAYVLYKSR